jgi:glucose-1-phosphate adenylyltransferase
MPADMHDVLGIILGGGRGTRLYPLTRMRAKPAVPMGGKYRLIDIPISNCINSEITRIAVLTQFKSVSLHRHIAQTYIFDAFSRGWVQIWAAEQRDSPADWYQGTADAVRKQLLEIQSARTEFTLILAGDHLYRMDYEDLADFHWANNADVSVAVQPIRKEDASRFGLLKVDVEGRIIEFAEKPKDPAVLERFVCRDDPDRPYLGSMGIYLFRTSTLVDLLTSTDDTDFGGEVIPRALENSRVYGFEFDGYWEDIGTIRNFYEVNLTLAEKDPPFLFDDQDGPIYSRSRFLPGSFVEGARLESVLLADGCFVGKADIHHCVIGVRSQIHENVIIRDSIMMGADYYDNPADLAKGGGIPIGIGAGSHIEGALIDKNARIGENVTIKPFPPGTERDDGDVVIVDGIVCVSKNAVVKPGTTIVPE